MTTYSMPSNEKACELRQALALAYQHCDADKIQLYSRLIDQMQVECWKKALA